jgi:hypothetical protein
MRKTNPVNSPDVGDLSAMLKKLTQQWWLRKGGFGRPFVVSSNLKMGWQPWLKLNPGLAGAPSE